MEETQSSDPSEEIDEMLHNFGDLEPIPEGATALCGIRSKFDGSGKQNPALNECCPICLALTLKMSESFADQCDKEGNWATVLFAAAQSEGLIDEKLGELFGSTPEPHDTIPDFRRPLFDKFGVDPYDASIEIMLRTEAVVPENFKEVLSAMGFHHGWINWADGTESYFNFTNQAAPSPRLPKQHPRWSEKKSEEEWKG
jgi:hypothetical protein